MALQVWLPLTGNKENQGLKNLSVTNNGATFTNDGKLGKCCHFNGSAQYLQLSETLGNIYSGDFTWALWLKPTDDTRGILISEYSSAGASNVALELYTNRKLRVYWAGSPDYILTYAPPKNTWTHLAVVKTHNLIRVYANGELVETKAGTLADKTSTAKIRIGDDYRGGTSVSYMGDLNDVRIYDHALTELDIKELYYGKVFELTPPWKNNNGVVTALGDASGENIGLTPVGNLTTNGNELIFDGSSWVEMKPLAISGGTLSVWFKMAKPTNAFLYVDGTSHMGCTFYSNATYIIPWIGTTAKKRFTASSVVWGDWNNITTTYDVDGSPIDCYVNGVSVAQSGTDYWTAGDTKAYLGRRGAANSMMTGSLGEVKVYTKVLTQDEIVGLYNKGLPENKWNQTRVPMWKNMEIIEESGATWLKVLHHNNPAANLFTTGNCKNNEAENLFSKLYLFDDATLLKRHNGTFEFVVKEKTLSTEPEHTFRWSQKSNPTAATVTGYTLVSQTMNPNRSFGLVHQTSRTHFDNKATWWCACGAYSPYNGGIPGFRDVVKSGYIDLYVRIDDTDFMKKGVNNEFIRLTGTQYFDSGLDRRDDYTIELCVQSEAKTNDAPLFGSRDSNGGGQLVLWQNTNVASLRYGSTELKYTYSPEDALLDKQVIRCHKTSLTIDDKVVATAATQTYSFSASPTVKLFTLQSGNSVDSRKFKGKVYYVKIWNNAGTLIRHYVPFVDSTKGVGLMELVSSTFYENKGTGACQLGLD